MIWFKSCPKYLNGDLEEKTDQDGRYLRCIQFGKHFESWDPRANEVMMTPVPSELGSPALVSIKAIGAVQSAGG